MRTELLDHGYAQLVDYWGSDEAIIEAARMSTGKGFKGWGLRCRDCGRSVTESVVEGKSSGVYVCIKHGAVLVDHGDEKLLRYLYENKHSTPFEMAGLTIEVQAPIFVFRQWHRHRTQSYSEMSARYTPLPSFNYMPTVERLMVNSTKNKQAGTAKGAGELTTEGAESFRSALEDTYEDLQNTYEQALANGVPKELARIHLPVARYSRMRASANLRNWLGFLTLRMDPHAQYEIRVYAEAVGKMIAEKFPRTWELFTEGRAI